MAWDLPGQAPLLEAEHEHDLVAPRSRAHQVQHVNTARLVSGRTTERRALERREYLLAGKMLAEALPVLELVEHTRRRFERAEVELRPLADGRGLEPVGRAKHRFRERPGGGQRLQGTGLVEDRDRLASVAQRLLFDALWIRDRPAPEPPLQIIDMCARQSRVGRPQERIERGTAAVEPDEAEQRAQRVPVRRLRQPEPALDGERDPEGRERGLERCACSLDGRADHGNFLRVDARAEQPEDLFSDELVRRARAGAFEEAKLAGQAGRDTGHVGEERALEMGQARLSPTLRPGRELFDASSAERGEIGRRPLERRERRTPGLVRERDRQIRARRQPFQQRPFGARQVLEAVSEDRSPVPGREVAGDASGGVPPLVVTVPEAEPPSSSR